MEIRRRTAGPLVLLGLIAACSTDPAGPGNRPDPIIEVLPRPLSASEAGIVQASNTFSAALLQAVNRGAYADSNVFLSPLSATMALGMTMNGAAGTTYDEMRQVLGFGTISREEILRAYRDLIALLRALDRRVDFRIANSIWYRTEFAAAVAPDFLAESRDFFGATTTALDFSAPSAVTTINGWVDTHTNGKIDRIVDSLSPDLVMLLVNAIYFKGDWREKFDAAATRPGPFTTQRGTTVQVPMMHRLGGARVATVGGRTAVELGYGGDAFAMTIVLPAEGEGIDALVRALSPDAWRSITGALAPRGEVELTMPKFRLAWEKTLNADLKSLGMETPFIGGMADFSRLSPSAGRRLFISFVKQRTFVDVHEEGTEAAAVTAVGIELVSAPQRTVIRVDRPFVFAIRERLSGTLLFVGKIINPVL